MEMLVSYFIFYIYIIVMLLPVVPIASDIDIQVSRDINTHYWKYQTIPVSILSFYISNRSFR